MEQTNETVPTCTECSNDEYCYQDMSDPTRFRCIEKPNQYVSTTTAEITDYLRGIEY